MKHLKRIFRYSILFILFSVISISFSVLNKLIGDPADTSGNLGSPLVAVIDIEEDIYSKDMGYMLGYHYEVLSLYGENQGVDLDILPNFNQNRHWKELMEGSVDLLVADLNSLDVPKEYVNEVLVSIPVRREEVWVVKKGREGLIENLNVWISHFRESKDFNDLTRRYFAIYEFPATLKTNSSIESISPYDDIIKKYSLSSGLDWRLMAAIVYKESKFSMGVQSHKDAKGLMQIKESTAKYYGITDLYDPESNIRAGILHFNRLKRKLNNYGVEGEDLIKFTLAAYNAGEGRIMDCISFAKSVGVNHHDWEEVASIIPMMSKSENYTGEYIKLGKFKGKETLSYVDDIMSIYNQLLSVI